MVFDIFIRSDEMDEYIDSGSYDSRRRLQNGSIQTINFIENFLENGLDYFDSGLNWGDFIYYSSNKLEEKIEEYLINNFKDKIDELNYENDDDEYFEDLKLVNKIKELYIDDLITVIRDSLGSAYEDAYYGVVHTSIEKVLDEYGGVLNLNYEGASIRVNLLHFENEIDSSKILTTVEQVQDELYYLVSEGFISKPKLYINDRYDVTINDSNFENNFYELCSDYNIPIKK